MDGGYNNQQFQNGYNINEYQENGYQAYYNDVNNYQMQQNNMYNSVVSLPQGQPIKKNNGKAFFGWFFMLVKNKMAAYAYLSLVLIIMPMMLCLVSFSSYRDLKKYSSEDVWRESLSEAIGNNSGEFVNNLLTTVSEMADLKFPLASTVYGLIDEKVEKQISKSLTKLTDFLIKFLIGDGESGITSNIKKTANKYLIFSIIWLSITVLMCFANSI
ncbi:MAG: hypothetical protein IJ167_00985, partial [Lachnospiraceae bacterium]|nr:hypothetical protein [Lachnospiraceae bacterium]